MWKRLVILRDRRADGILPQRSRDRQTEFQGQDEVGLTQEEGEEGKSQPGEPCLSGGHQNCPPSPASSPTHWLLLSSLSVPIANWPCDVCFWSPWPGSTLGFSSLTLEESLSNSFSALNHVCFMPLHRAGMLSLSVLSFFKYLFLPSHPHTPRTWTYIIRNCF